jgi:hypothetical protein
VQCEKIKKEYGFVYNKRVIVDDFKTLPYGHISLKKIA